MGCIITKDINIDVTNKSELELKVSNAQINDIASVWNKYITYGLYHGFDSCIRVTFNFDNYISFKLDELNFTVPDANYKIKIIGSNISSKSYSNDDNIIGEVYEYVNKIIITATLLKKDGSAYYWGDNIPEIITSTGLSTTTGNSITSIKPTSTSVLVTNSSIFNSTSTGLSTSTDTDILISGYFQLLIRELKVHTPDVINSLKAPITDLIEGKKYTYKYEISDYKNIYKFTSDKSPVYVKIEGNIEDKIYINNGEGNVIQYMTGKFDGAIIQSNDNTITIDIKALETESGEFSCTFYTGTPAITDLKVDEKYTHYYKNGDYKDVYKFTSDTTGAPTTPVYVKLEGELKFGDKIYVKNGEGNVINTITGTVDGAIIQSDDNTIIITISANYSNTGDFSCTFYTGTPAITELEVDNEYTYQYKNSEYKDVYKFTSDISPVYVKLGGYVEESWDFLFVKNGEGNVIKEITGILDGTIIQSDDNTIIITIFADYDYTGEFSCTFFTGIAPITGAPTTGAPTTGAPTTGAPTTGAPTTTSQILNMCDKTDWPQNPNTCWGDQAMKLCQDQAAYNYIQNNFTIKDDNYGNGHNYKNNGIDAAAAYYLLEQSKVDNGKCDIPTTTTVGPTTRALTTGAPTTGAPTTGAPTTGAPTTGAPTTGAPTTGKPTTGVPTTGKPTTGKPTTGKPTTGKPTTGKPTTGAPTTGAPTTGAPTTGAPTTGAPIFILMFIILSLVSILVFFF